MPQITNIPIEQLFSHPDNPRKDLGDLSELVTGIQANGILQNLTVVPGHNMTDAEWREMNTKYQENPSDELRAAMNSRKCTDGYTIIIGHRRHAAAKLAGLTELPCVITEMTAQEQLQTMMVENMQRSDLTTFEQAQGFQMMLDMGDSVADVAKKSGFSETTVRNRVKLTKLDAAKFQKAETRGATLSDYMELDKLEDLKDKNKALDAIGTANFRSVLNGLLDSQKLRKKLAEWAEIADSFAFRIEKRNEYNGENVKMDYFRSCDRWSLEMELSEPQDAAEVRYFYLLTDRDITIYKEADQAQVDAATEARNERLRKQEEIRNEFKAVAAAHYELRRDFVKELSNSVLKKHMREFSLFCASALEEMSGYSNDVDLELCTYLLGMRFSEEDESTEACDIPAIRSASEAQPEKLIFALCYSAIDAPDERYYDTRWMSGDYVYEHEDNFTLDHIYDMLCTLGYEMSDDELDMQNGTHQLFSLYGAKQADAAEDGDDE